MESIFAVVQQWVSSGSLVLAGAGAFVGGTLTAFLYINQVNRQLAQLEKKVTTLTQNLALENYMSQEKRQNEQ